MKIMEEDTCRQCMEEVETTALAPKQHMSDLSLKNDDDQRDPDVEVSFAYIPPNIIVVNSHFF